MMATATTNRIVDVLTGLRQLLRRLESRQVSVKQGNTDVTSQEIAAATRDRATRTRVLPPLWRRMKLARNGRATRKKRRTGR